MPSATILRCAAPRKGECVTAAVKTLGINATTTIKPAGKASDKAPE
jgi:hypothetical protein